MFSLKKILSEKDMFIWLETTSETATKFEIQCHIKLRQIHKFKVLNNL